MQPSRKMKKAQDYDIGELVCEGDYDAGKVAAVLADTGGRPVAYLLVVNAKNEYTIYRGLTNCNAGLSLARNVPESVSMQFAEVIMGGEAPEVPKAADRKYPVVAKEEEKETEKNKDEKSNLEIGTPAPYFDFV